MHRRKSQDTASHDGTSHYRKGSVATIKEKTGAILVVPVFLMVLLVIAMIHTQIMLLLNLKEGQDDAGNGKSINYKKHSLAFISERTLIETETPHTRSMSSTESNQSLLLPIDYHIVFSTTCSAQQDWESYVLFYHAFKVKQPGNVTRIASGCNKQEAKALTAFHENVIQKISDRFHLHFTPDYSNIRVNHDDKRPYKYMNKPFGLRHWLENKLGFAEGRPLPEAWINDVVILLDPDMILLKPITHDFSKSRVIWVDAALSGDRMQVRHGNPMAQQDGYLGNVWLEFNFTFITGDPHSPAYKVNISNAMKNYNTGPPYLATVKDMWNIAVKWTEMAPLVHDIFPKLFAEMFGFCSATAHLELPHTMIKSIVVSDTTSKNREGWQLVDALPLDQTCHISETANLPYILHYCKRYLVGKWFWSKYRLRKNFLSCDVDLLEMPPSNITSMLYHFSPPAARGQPIGKMEQMSAKQSKREVFMVCQVIEKVNEAVEHYKRQQCDPKIANLSRTYNFYNYPGKY